MASVKIFSTVGTTPQAVANALSSHLMTFEEKTEVECYFFMGSTSSHTFPDRTSSDISSIIDGFNINKRHLKKLDSLKITLHTDNLIDIYEHDLVENVALIVSKSNKIIEDGDQIIFDITGGRKMMTGAALLSIMILRQKRPACSFKIGYYWLKKFTPENLNKMLFELGFDAYESIFASLEAIDERVRTLRK